LQNNICNKVLGRFDPFSVIQAKKRHTLKISQTSSPLDGVLLSQFRVMRPENRPPGYCAPFWNGCAGPENSWERIETARQHSSRDGYECALYQSAETAGSCPPPPRRSSVLPNSWKCRGEGEGCQTQQLLLQGLPGGGGIAIAPCRLLAAPATAGILPVVCAACVCWVTWGFVSCRLLLFPTACVDLLSAGAIMYMTSNINAFSHAMPRLRLFSPRLRTPEVQQNSTNLPPVDPSHLFSPLGRPCGTQPRIPPAKL
jgi:hypothetical protein